MSSIVVSAASYLDACGYGNDVAGLRAWPEDVVLAVQRGEWQALRWAAMFPSPCPRFGRMDPLSRLALLAAELLEARLETWPAAVRENVGVCLQTCWGCLSADVEFLRSASPSVFAYTLPSTAIGEICIRYLLKGPVLCLTSSRPDGDLALSEAADWLRQGEAEACLCLSCDAIAGGAGLPAGLSPSPPAGYGLAAAALLEKPASPAQTLTGRSHALDEGMTLPVLARKLASARRDG